MEIFTTYSSIRKYNSESPLKIGMISFERKTQIDNFHQGHLDIINILKQNSDLVMANFWATNELFSYLFKEQSIVPERNKPDKQACINWCSQNGVDIVFWPNNGETIESFNNYDISSLIEWANNYASNANYVINNSFLYLLYVSMICEKVRKEQDLFRRDLQVTSWKDGIWTIYQKHFRKTFSNNETILINPVIDPVSNLPLGNNTTYNLMNNDEKEWIKQIPLILENNKYLLPNIDSFKQIVIDQINSLDTSNKFHVVSIDIYNNSNFFRTGEHFVSIELYVNSQWKLNNKQGCFFYNYFIQGE